MDLFLQVWGGIFYLLNKIFLSFAEKVEDEKKEKRLRIAGWLVYLIGLPAWAMILISKSDWIVVSIEIGGSPSMILGLVIATLSSKQVPKLLDRVAEILAYTLLILGVGYSVYHFGGITTMSQVLELGVTAGFLLGTYNLAKKNPTGWIWFGLMNGSNAALMLLQGKPILFFQQLISLGFVVYGYINAKRKPRKEEKNKEA